MSRSEGVPAGTAFTAGESHGQLELPPNRSPKGSHYRRPLSLGRHRGSGVGAGVRAPLPRPPPVSRVPSPQSPPRDSPSRSPTSVVSTEEPSALTPAPMCPVRHGHVCRPRPTVIPSLHQQLHPPQACVLGAPCRAAPGGRQPPPRRALRSPAQRVVWVHVCVHTCACLVQKLSDTSHAQNEVLALWEKNKAKENVKRSPEIRNAFTDRFRKVWQVRCVRRT